MNDKILGIGIGICLKKQELIDIGIGLKNTYCACLVFLFEPDESNAWLGELDIGEGLLEVQNPRKPYVILPVGNHTKHTIILPTKTALGTIQSVEQVISLDQTGMSKPKVTVDSAVLSSTSPDPSLWQPNVDLSHLNEEQRAVVNKMLCEEAGAFARDSNDIGLPSLQMTITLHDTIPVQKSYSSIPKPLFTEVHIGTVNGRLDSQVHVPIFCLSCLSGRRTAACVCALTIASWIKRLSLIATLCLKYKIWQTPSGATPDLVF